MTQLHELIVSSRDAAVLSSLMRERGPAPLLEDLLLEARRVLPDELPADRIAMESNVTYEEEPGGERRRVIVVHPDEADAAFGRISVLSPVGLALLGRAPGERVSAALPGGRALSIRILETSPRREPVLA